MKSKFSFPNYDRKVQNIYLFSAEYLSITFVCNLIAANYTPTFYFAIIMVYNTRSTRSLPPSPGPAVAGLRTPGTPSTRNAFSRFSLGTFPDLGGGSSDRHGSPAPDLAVNMTPPRPSVGGTGNSKGKSCNCICRTTRNLYSFSPKTCLELLRSGVLSSDQLEFERLHLQSLGFEIDTVVDSKLTHKVVVQNALENNLNIHNCSLVENTVTNLANINACLSYSADYVETWKRRVLPETPTPTPATAQRIVPDTSRVEPSTPTEQKEDGKLDDTVCRVFDLNSVKFTDLSVETILEQIKVDSPATHGNRLTAYFGNTAYRYGHVKHDPQPYPDCPVFDNIFNKLQPLVPDFTPSNYSCLVTLYPDGQSMIKPHSDNEEQICPGSSIYTISVGSGRTAVFQNQLGVINEAHIPLPHGSVYSMSRASQSSWKHSILAEPHITASRVSFTFRKLVPEADIPRRPRAPPIVHPDEYQSPSSPPRGSHQGVLLLTDSILAGTPEFLFDKIDGFRCIKKINKRLTDIFNFEPEFRYRKTVVISGGVNDLSCYGLRAHVLADLVCNRLIKTCQNLPNTTFIFNSILYTGHSWLNEEIDEFNRIMFDLSLRVPNLFFFDSSAVIESSPLSRRWDSVIQRSDPRLVHITLAARRLISDELVKGVDLVCRGVEKAHLRTWSWPLRPSFADRLSRRHLT